MSRKKSTKTTSHLDGIKRTTEINNDDELNKCKYVYSSGVRKKILNQDLMGRKMKVDVDVDYRDYETEDKIGYIRNEDLIEHSLNHSRKRKGAKQLYESDYDEYEVEDDNYYDSETNDEYDHNQEEIETFENEHDDKYEGYQQEQDCTTCKECDKTNRKISNYTKVTFILILIILSATLGYAISFFDGITY